MIWRTFLLLNNPTDAERKTHDGKTKSLVDKHIWGAIGSGCLPSDLLVALLFSQLEEREPWKEY